MLACGRSQVRTSFSLKNKIRWTSRLSVRRLPSRKPSDHFVSIQPENSSGPASDPKPCAASQAHSYPQSPSASVEPPLFSELFPEEAKKKNVSQSQSENTTPKIPPLQLPTVAELLDGVEGYHPSHLVHSRATSKEASSDAYKHKKTTLLVLELASKSLVESDFRRIAPKGAHISGWTGRGDILKVFPARDPATFEQLNHYFIIFANPAYARTYQSHVHHLYRFARKHTPTSIESPLPPQPGERINDEDAYTMLQDFTLCPPSQRIQLKYIYGVLTPGMRALIDRGGYLRLPDGIDRAGRSVLFWVDGHQPALREINNAIASDGRRRGMSWNVSIGKVDASAALPVDSDGHVGLEGDNDGLETTPQRKGPRRWVLTFSDENEARSFIRAWHKTQLDPIRPDEPRIVQAEFLW